MSRYSDQDKRRILDEARATLAEIEQERAGFGEDAEADSEFRGSPDWLEQMLGPSDPLERFRAEQKQLEAERARYQERTAADINRENTAGWNRFVRSHIANALDEHDKVWIESIGQVVGEERKYFHAYIDHIAKQIRAEFATALAARAAAGDETVRQLRAEMARTKAVDAGTLIDISPEPVVRKVRS